MADSMKFHTNFDAALAPIVGGDLDGRAVIVM